MLVDVASMLCTTHLQREDYSKVTASNLFPRQSCQHRCLENLPVTDRVIEIWPHFQKYVTSVRVKLPEPKGKSFSVVLESSDDPLLVTKVNICVWPKGLFYE